MFTTSCFGQLDNNYIFVESNDYDFFLTPTCIFFLYPTFIFFTNIIFSPEPFFSGTSSLPPLKNGEKDVDSSPLLQQRQSMYGMTKGAKGELASGYSVTDRLIHQSSNLPVRDSRRCCTCWWYSWCTLKYGSNDTNSRITWGVEVIRAIFFSYFSLMF
jgi:hypothetical protein